MQLTRENYLFHGLQQSGDHTVALFKVEQASGQLRDELLNFVNIEVRIRNWDEALAAHPDLAEKDPRGAANYVQYVKALVEGLKQWKA